MRLTPLSQSTCLSLNQAIRSLFKAKTQFPRTAPNAIFHGKMFFNLQDIWTEQIAEISTALLNQFNSNSPLLLKISRIRLLHLQQQELAAVSPLRHWTPLFDFSHYRYNNIAAQLYLLKSAQFKLTFQCANRLANPISGGSKVITDLLSPMCVRKFRLKLLHIIFFFRNSSSQWMALLSVHGPNFVNDLLRYILLLSPPQTSSRNCKSFSPHQLV